MILKLTNKPDGRKIRVNTEHVKLWEPDADGTSTHVVFGADMVRVVKESLDQIDLLIGVSAPEKL